MVVQKTICWPNLGCTLRRAVCRSRIHSEVGTGSCCSATQHYPTTSAAAAVWAGGPSFPVSAMVLIYTYSLSPARALSKTLLFVYACCRRKLFSGDFNSLIFELTRLILAHVVRRGTVLSSRGTSPGWPRPRAATAQYVPNYLLR